MPQLSLSPEQRQQLTEWVNGGPSDPTGLNNWIAANCPGNNACYQAIGERDFYQLLLDKDGSNIKRQDITTQMADALAWVSDSLDAWEAAGLPIPEHQGQMRPLWAFLRGLAS